MLYTPSHAELGQHPKTRKLARRLGVSIPTAIGHLHLLWHFALKYAQDGDLSRFDNDEIADGCMWEGDPSDLYEAFCAAGWIEDATIHDWHEYGGKAIKQKEGNAERQQRWRDRHKTVSKPSPNNPVTVTSPLYNALEEKRIDQKIEEETIDPPNPPKGGGRAKRAAPKTPLPADFTVTDAMRAWADEKAPGVDIDVETERFLDRNRREGSTYADWPAAWRFWMTSEYPKAMKGNVHAIATRRPGNSRQAAGYGHRRLALGAPGSHGPGGHDSWREGE